MYKLDRGSVLKVLNSVVGLYVVSGSYSPLVHAMEVLKRYRETVVAIVLSETSTQ
jgi:hypothetical protein